MATEETHRSPSPKKNRGINWSDEATEALLELWAEESIQMSLEHLVIKRNSSLLREYEGKLHCCLSTLSEVYLILQSLRTAIF